MTYVPRRLNTARKPRRAPNIVAGGVEPDLALWAAAVARAESTRATIEKLYVRSLTERLAVHGVRPASAGPAFARPTQARPRLGFDAATTIIDELYVWNPPTKPALNPATRRATLTRYYAGTQDENTTALAEVSAAAGAVAETMGGSA